MVLPIYTSSVYDMESIVSVVPPPYSLLGAKLQAKVLRWEGWQTSIQRGCYGTIAIYQRGLSIIDS